MADAAVLPMASAAGKNQFERERLARIAMIEAKMKEIMEGVDTSLIRKQPRMPKVKASGPKKRKAAAADQDVRRSSRIHNLPVPLYCIEEDPTDCSSRSRRYSTTPGGKGPNGRRCHGAAAAAALSGGAADPYMVPPLGWKKECGSASLAAAEAATDAALALVRQLNEQGRPAVVKLMSSSQVSGGFWCQLPIDLGPYYGTDKQQHKRTLTLHCFDQAQQDPDSFMYAQPGSSAEWSVVHMPKGEGSCCGLSGGWRGFAVDQRIFPNDTVVFACLDKVPAAPAASTATDAQAAAKQSSSAEIDKGTGTDGAHDSGSESAGGAAELQQQQVASQGISAAMAAPAAGVKPRDRMHMQAYIFRAYNYEADGSNKQQQLQQPPTPQQATDAAAHGRMGSLTPGASSHPQQQLGEDQAHGTAEEGEKHMLADSPLAKRAKLVAGPDAAPEQQQRRSSRAVVSQGSGCNASALSGLQQPPLSPEQQAVQQLGLMEAAEAGALGVKVARQGSSTIRIAGNPTAAAEGAGQHQQKELAAAAAGAGGAQKQAGKAAGVAAAAAPRQKRAAAAAASKAWGGTQRNAKGNTSSSSKAKSAGGVRLVPKPADPSQMVPAPSKAELASGNSGASYEVEIILAHRVNPTTGADEFLISWLGYGPYWDSWEGLACLEAAPGSYPWQGGKKAIPRKFRL